jgi:hypothetical protein
MKELLTKQFWRDVKKTFDEAREEITPNSEHSQDASPGEAKSKGTESAEIPPVVEQPSRD